MVNKYKLGDAVMWHPTKLNVDRRIVERYGHGPYVVVETTDHLGQGVLVDPKDETKIWSCYLSDIRLATETEVLLYG